MVIDYVLPFPFSYWIAERRVPQVIPVLGSQPAGDVSHKPGGRPLVFVGCGLSTFNKVLFDLI